MPGSSAVRIGLIGAGRWGRAHLRSILALPELRLVRLASRNPESPRLVPPGCVVSPDWRSVVDAHDVDGIVIAAPPHVHAEIADAALREGTAVLVEKPLALSVREARALLDLAMRRGGVLQVNHVDLFNPAWVALKTGLPEVGELASIEAVFAGDGPLRPDVHPRWDWGPHPVALCLDLVGDDPVVVRAERVLARQEPAGLREQVEIGLTFPSGPTAWIVTGNAASTTTRRVVVEGSSGSLVYDDRAPDPLTRMTDGVPSALPVVMEPPLSCALRSFADSIRAGRPDWHGAALGLAVVSVLEQVDRSLPAPIGTDGRG